MLSYKKDVFIYIIFYIFILYLKDVWRWWSLPDFTRCRSFKISDVQHQTLCQKFDDCQEWNWTCYKRDITGRLSCISGASSPEVIAGGLQFCRKPEIHSVLLLVVSPGGPSVHIVSPGHRQAGLRAAHSEWVETLFTSLSLFEGSNFVLGSKLCLLDSGWCQQLNNSLSGRKFKSVETRLCLSAAAGMNF